MQSPRDGQALAQALKVNRTLQKLWLSANSIGDPGAEAPGWGGSPRGWMVKFVGENEACGRCFRPVCLGAFLVRYLGLLEYHWNLLNSFTAGNICTAWLSHKLWPQFLHLLQGSWSELPHKLTLQDMHKIKASREVKTASLFFSHRRRYSACSWGRPTCVSLVTMFAIQSLFFRQQFCN